MDRRAFLRLAGLAGVAGAASACGLLPQPEPPPQTGVVRRSVPLGEVTVIRVAHQSPPGDLTPVLFDPAIREAVGMEEYGELYRVEPVPKDDSDEALAAVVDGASDIAVVDLWTFARRVAQGLADMRIIASLVTDGQDGHRSDVFRSMAHLDMVEPAQLRGRRVTGGPAGSLHTAVLRRWLDAGGVNPDNGVEWAEHDYDRIGSELRAGSVVLGPLVAPYDAFEAARGGMRNVFTLADLLGASERLVMVARAGWLIDNRLAVRVFQADRLRAQAWALGEGRDAAIELCAELSRFRPAVIALSFGNRRDDYRSPGGCLAGEHLARPLRRLARWGALEREVDLARLVDHSYVPGPCVL